LTLLLLLLLLLLVLSGLSTVLLYVSQPTTKIARNGSAILIDINSESGYNAMST